MQYARHCKSLVLHILFEKLSHKNYFNLGLNDKTLLVNYHLIMLKQNHKVWSSRINLVRKKQYNRSYSFPTDKLKVLVCAWDMFGTKLQCIYLNFKFSEDREEALKKECVVFEKKVRIDRTLNKDALTSTQYLFIWSHRLPKMPRIKFNHIWVIWSC